MSTLWSFLRRDAAIAASYRVATLLPLLSIGVTVPLVAFLGQVFDGADVQSLGPYRNEYFAFLLIGMAFQDYAALGMSTFLTGIREHQMMGTLEIVMLSPTPVPLILLYSSVWGYLFNSLRFALYMAIGALCGLDLSHANLFSFALLAGAALLCFAALGILGAAVTLVIKQGTGITTYLTAMTLAFGGVAYPIGVMPEWLQKIALLLPFTHALTGIRKALLLGASPADVGVEIGALVLFAVALLPCALWAFRTALGHAKLTGSLAKY